MRTLHCFKHHAFIQIVCKATTYTITIYIYEKKMAQYFVAVQSIAAKDILYIYIYIYVCRVEEN